VTSCRRIRNLIGPYLYGDLDSRERDWVEAHLRACARCRAEVAGAQKMLARTPETLLRPSAEARERITEAVAMRMAEEPAGELLPRRPAWGAPRLALAGAATLIVGIWIGHQLPQRPVAGHAGPARTAAISTAPSPDRVSTAAGSQAAPNPVVPQGEPERAHAATPQRRPMSPDKQQARENVRPRQHERIEGTPKLALRAPEPEGIDDVRLAEAIRTEATP